MEALPAFRDRAEGDDEVAGELLRAGLPSIVVRRGGVNTGYLANTDSSASRRAFFIPPGYDDLPGVPNGDDVVDDDANSCPTTSLNGAAPLVVSSKGDHDSHGSGTAGGGLELELGRGGMLLGGRRSLS